MSPISNVSRRGFLKGLQEQGHSSWEPIICPSAAARRRIRKNGCRSCHSAPEPFCRNRHRWHGVHCGASFRDGYGDSYYAADGGADELDADWKRIKIDQAIGDLRYGDQNTDGSHSVRSFFDVMRQAGATARSMLILAAAQKWGVPPAECQTDLHAVVHPPSNRRLGYGELATAASKLPVPTSGVRLKNSRSVALHRKGMTSYDLSELCTGRAIYGEDFRVKWHGICLHRTPAGRWRQLNR